MTEWKKVRIGNLCETNAKSYSPKENWEFVNYLDTGNITRNAIDKIQYIDLHKEKLPSRAKRKVQHNSVLFSTVRPNQLHYGIVKAQPKNFLVSTGFAVMDADTKLLDPDYLYYLLSSSDIVEGLHAIAEQSTSAYPSIKPSDIENLEVSIPDLATQQKISSVLVDIDEKIRSNTAINKNLEQQLQLLYDHLTEGFSGEPIELSSIVDIRDGTHDSPKPVKIGFPLVTSKHLLPFGVDLSSTNSISEKDYDKINERSKVDTYDILISMIGTVGLVSFVIESPVNYAIKNVGLFKTSKCPDLFAFILPYLKSAKTAQYIERTLAGSTQKYISLGELRKMPITLPSGDKLQKYNKVAIPLINQIINLAEENKCLTETRDVLLPKLMAGELDVSNIDL